MQSASAAASAVQHRAPGSNGCQKAAHLRARHFARLGRLEQNVFSAVYEVIGGLSGAAVRQRVSGAFSVPRNLLNRDATLAVSDTVVGTFESGVCIAGSVLS